MSKDSSKDVGRKLNYADIDRLRQDLSKLSTGDARSDEDLLREASLGSGALRDPVVAQLAAKLANRLYHHKANAVVRDLCRGALIAVIGRKPNARELLPFALHLIEHDASASPLPFPAILPETAAKARTFLEDYSRRPAQIDLLVSAVKEFAACNDAMAGGLLFARFIADLEFLRDVALNEQESETHRRAAVGALTYFVEKHDAIDDELGVVGMLDDAYVARLTSEEIEPMRRMKTALVDSLLGKWPFLATLKLMIDGSTWTPSEFLLFELATTLGTDADRLTCTVSPKVSSRPLWLGVHAALGFLFDALDTTTAAFRPAIGEFVSSDAEGRDGIEVLGYFQPPGGSPSATAPPEIAQLVELRVWPKTRRPGAEPVKWKRPVAFLDTCVAAPPSSRRRRLVLPSSRAQVALGPLETLFGIEHPARFSPSKRHCVVVVGPLGDARAFMENTTFCDRKLSELIPCAQVAPDSESGLKWWSQVPPSADSLPALAFARTIPDAANFVARATGAVSVFLPIEREEWEAASLIELGNARIVRHLVALTRQDAFDVHAALDKLKYRFLDWSEQLASAMSHRPQKARGNEIDLYESALRSHIHAEPQIHRVDMDSIESALQSLKELGAIQRREYDDDIPTQFVSWAYDAQRLFFDLVAVPVRLEAHLAAEVCSRLERLEQTVGDAVRLMSQPCQRAARLHLEQLRHALVNLTEKNPKAVALESLLTEEQPLVHCSPRQWSLISAHFPHLKHFSDRGEFVERPVVVFEWRGAGRMARIILPPVGHPTHAVLYGWERAALDGIRQRRAEAQIHHAMTNVRPKTWVVDSRPEQSPASSRSDLAFQTDELEAWANGLRRRKILSHVANLGGDDVVEAIPVHFVGSKYALYQREFELHVAPNYKERKRAEPVRLHEKSATELRPGDVIVLLARSGRDAIRTRADQRLPPGARALARTWHGALQRFRHSLHSDKALCSALRAAGCTRMDQTILGWLYSSTQIGPHEEEDVGFIAVATRDGALIRSLDECKHAIRLVRGEHQRASHDLAQTVLREFESRIERGETIDATIELEDLELLVVDHVDAPIMAAASSTNFVVDMP